MNPETDEPLNRAGSVVFDNFPDLIVRWDKNGRYLYANPLMRQTFGLSQAQIIGKTQAELPIKQPEGQVERLTQRLQQVFATGIPQTCEATCFTEQGERRLEVRYIPETDGQTAVVTVLGILRDITERKQAEADLHEAHQLLETIFDHTHMMVAYLDPQLNFIRVNRAYANADEKDPDYFIGKNHFDLYPNPENEAIFRQVAATGEPYFAFAKPFEYADNLERGTTYWDWSLVPIKDVDGTVVGLIFTLLNITKRLWAEQALRESELKFRNIYDQAPIGIELYDAEGMLIDANPACLAMFGLADLNQVLGFDLFADPNLPDEAKDAIRRGEAAKYEVLFDFDLVQEKGLYETSKSGKSYLDCLISPMIMNGGEIGGYLLHTRDVTGRKMVEMALQDSEQRYRTVVSVMAEGVVLHQGSGEILFANTAAERILGLTVDQLMGRSSFDPRWRAIHEDGTDFPGETHPAMISLQTGQPVHQVIMGVHKPDGTLSWILVNSQPLFREGETTPYEVVATFNDITLLKRAALEREQFVARIHNQSREMQCIVDTVPDGIFLLSEDDYVRLTNPIAETYLALLAPRWRTDVLVSLGNRPLVELLTSPPKGLWHEVVVDGRYFEVIARAIEERSQHQGWVFVVRDVTQRRQIRQQIESQERLAAVGQLAAGIAHDFNNTLAVITLYTGLLLRTVDLPAKAQERLEVVEQQAQRAATLIQQILDFSRQSLMEKQPLALLPFLKEMVRLLTRTLPETIAIKLEAEPSELLIQADPARIQQVVLNLALNARDAMPQGGELSLVLRRLSLTKGDVPPVQGMEVGDWVQVSAIDTGSGMSAETLAHIFEPFFTTKAKGKGSGLGMAQVYGIVQQHEGFIDVVTEVDQGTAVHLYFPAYTLQSYQPLRLPDDTVPRGQGQMILLVEDEATIREALTENLLLLNYRVLSAHNGRVALTLLSQHINEIDLILSDVVMPEMGGSALLHALQEQNINIPFVMMTGHAVEKNIENLRPLGLRGWLTKPPDLAKLAQLLQQTLRSS